MAQQAPQPPPPPEDQERRQREAEQKWAQHLDARRESCARLAELQAALKERGLDTEGKKVVLEQRLAEAEAAESRSAAAEPEPDDTLSLLKSLAIVSLPAVPGAAPAETERQGEAEAQPDDALSLLESLESPTWVPGQMPAGGAAVDTGAPQAALDAALDDDDLMQRLA